MSFSIEGKKCQVCNAYLFDNDDVVFCPTCGAPHHRECYKSLGHCALEEFHGTENQYDSEKENEIEEDNKKDYKIEEDGEKIKFTTVNVKCKNCGENFDASLNYCPKCGTQNHIKMNTRFINIDFLGGVPADTDLGDGVTAKEAKDFVFANTQRFIPKFLRMKEGGKASFNLLAFFFPCAWALSRKMYKLGAILGALQVALYSVFFSIGNIVMNGIPDEVKTDALEMTRYYLENPNSFNKSILMLGFVCGLLLLGIMIVCGVFGDYFYRNHAIKTIKDIKQNSDDIEADMRKKGGVNLILMLLGLVITEYLPQIIISLAK